MKLSVVLFNPISNEMFYAEKGCGAYLTQGLEFQTKKN